MGGWWCEPITQVIGTDCLIVGRVRGMNEQHGIETGASPGEVAIASLRIRYGTREIAALNGR